MQVLILTETGTPQDVDRPVFDASERFRMKSLPPTRKLEDDTTLSTKIQDYPADFVALCARVTGQEQVQAILKEAGVADDQPHWVPHSPGAPSDFLVQQLGLSLAGLWFPVWRVGTVLLPARLLGHLNEDAGNTLEQVVKLSLPLGNGDPHTPIDWSDNLLPLPALSPRKSRATTTQLQLINSAKNWLPDSFRKNSPEFAAMLAGCLLWLDELDRSHSYSQSVEHQGIRRAGDYWHAIMHRREPDYGNSKYWYRNAGDQPFFDALHAQAQSAAAGLKSSAVDAFCNQPQWDPFAFVDFCSNARGGSDDDLFARRMQAVEMVLAMRQATEDAQ